MALNEQDRNDIIDLVNLHGHVVDSGRLDGLGDLLSPDVTYDLRGIGGPTLRGLAAVHGAAVAVGAAKPVGHHVTNIVIADVDDRSARVRSKGIGIQADGTSGSIAYDDVVVRLPDGWRISHRTVTARPAVLGTHDSGPRAVLERWRRAVLGRSVDDLRRLYSVDAIHEFPFPYPGMRSRLEGRDDIMDWIVAGWAADVPTFERYQTIAVHDTGDPDTIVVEQQACSVSAEAGEFALLNIVVLTARHGQIIHLRDYVDVLAAAGAIGRHITSPTT